MIKKTQSKPSPKPPKGSDNAGATSLQDLGGPKTIYGTPPVRK